MARSTSASARRTVAFRRVFHLRSHGRNPPDEHAALSRRQLRRHPLQQFQFDGLEPARPTLGGFNHGQFYLDNGRPGCATPPPAFNRTPERGVGHSENEARDRQVLPYGF